MNTVLKYPGAKNGISKWICSHIPEHKVYLEAYFGGGAIFFNKEPADLETINDLDSNVVNYFRVLREKSDELIRLLELTPFSRDEYEAAYYESLDDTDVEKARKFCIKCFMGFGCGNLYRNGFRSSQQSTSPKTALAWNKLPETLIQANNRLRQAQIENLPAVELIKRYNTKDVFVYLDPPYLPGTRKPHLYKHEMSIEDHIELLEVVLSHPGKVLISGYNNDLYNQYLKGWYKASKRTTAENGLYRVETIWMNYSMYQITLDLR